MHTTPVTVTTTVDHEHEFAVGDKLQDRYVAHRSVTIEEVSFVAASPQYRICDQEGNAGVRAERYVKRYYKLIEPTPKVIYALEIKQFEEACWVDCTAPVEARKMVAAMADQIKRWNHKADLDWELTMVRPDTNGSLTTSGSTR